MLSGLKEAVPVYLVSLIQSENLLPHVERYGDSSIRLLVHQHTRWELHFIWWWSALLNLPWSLVLGIFPQGLVAVTVAAQVASMSARFSTPVLFFLPVARSHSPQAWKSYLHSPGGTQRESDTSLDAFVWWSRPEGRMVKKQKKGDQVEYLLKWHTLASVFVFLRKQSTAISQ